MFCERAFTHSAASESVVFDTLGAKFIRDLRPGEIMELTTEGVHSTRLPHPTNAAHCMLVWVYFSRPVSVLDGRIVLDVRVMIGRELAADHPVEADMVVAIPDSGRAHPSAMRRSRGSRWWKVSSRTATASARSFSRIRPIATWVST